MNIYLIIILAIIAFRYLLESTSDLLNLKAVSPDIPEEFKGYYDAEKYGKSQDYLRETTRWGLFVDSINTVVLVIFILAGGFGWIDGIVRSLSLGPILTGVCFAYFMMLTVTVLGLPFSIYSTFVIEKKYGFNRTTPKTFVADFFKSMLLMFILGGAIFSLVLWIFGGLGDLAWLYCWGAVAALQIFLMFIAPYVIMPIFNKFTPLEDGELRDAIEAYAKSQGFKMKGVFCMDGSKRSSKSNAFFTGFGKTRRIVLYDTLIKNHSVDELVAIIAHEMGHYKLKHIPSAIVRSLVVSCFMFFLLGLCLNNEGLFAAFGVDNLSIYMSLFLFGFLYSPVSMLVGIVESIISRKHEFQADAYAAETSGLGESMISGLKQLSVDNLSNLTPHPFTVFLTYSHPPVLQRIRAIEGKREN
ncbi:MAG: M48 family metallopeptidase [Kiritimatiellae bacterium]|nr:M48 family metallopeptidase [Kiritimatiellia bacterium]